MIATNTTNPLPNVLFPVMWPAREWHRTAALLERVRAGVGENWGLLASLVELARGDAGVGLLCVTLEPSHAVGFRSQTGATWMAANAVAVWKRELPTPGAFSLLPGSAQADIRTPPTDREVTVVCAVLDDSAEVATNTAVGRVCDAKPHAEWAARTLEERPEFAELPYVMVVELDLAGGVQP
jgi:hypothetical protein